jgi:HK97 family phage portal protein
MILATRNGGNVEVRDSIFQGTDRIPLPSEAGGTWSYALKRVTVAEAYGLPVVLSAIRLLSETIASMPLVVYKDDADGDDDARIRATGTPQWKLLHDRPNSIQTRFEFIAYIIASLNGYGNAFVLKTKSRGRVQELWTLDPSKISITVDGRDITYKYRDPNTGKFTILTAKDLIHIRGIMAQDPFVGVSPITAHRNAIGEMMGLEEFSGKFYANDATPSGILKTSRRLNDDEKIGLRDSWEQGHRTSVNSHRLAVISGPDLEYQQLGLNAADAQLIESRHFTARVAAQIFRVPNAFLGEVDSRTPETPEATNMKFLTYSLVPWMARLEQALVADDDLFPQKDLSIEFQSDSLLRATQDIRFSGYVQARQAGWLSGNEIRAKEGYPPVKGLDDVQQTPVGGAPNEGIGQGSDGNITPNKAPEEQPA